MTPAWLDGREYPWEPRTLAVDGGRLSFVDEGQGPPVLMVHGTPTWSFLYRHLVARLSDGHRCIAPDLLGFGLSDRPADASYEPQAQAARLGALVERLGLEDATLVVHDFGGPIGLAWALDHPERVRRLVLFNTWMWSIADDRRLAWPGRLFASPAGRLLYERFNFSVEVVWKSALKDRRRYTRAVHRHYAAPLAAPADRRATWAYARALTGAGAWYDALWARRERLRAIPALLVWGLDDPAFGRYLDRWRGVFDDAEVVALAGVGHAPPEERGPEVAEVVARFLDRRAAPVVEGRTA